ncbi:palmitoyltransferase ZDHHC23 [Aethina tumida]|uniref:palmitoyltransferase ZDHHC23 n=1 Tax=Aethina tumida TaxID=116153 RepID=UPI00096B5F00|nr:palmitoyltransferase ZDHHC23 [Aethina tumida]
MNETTVPLCCCEYYDRNNERNHILACLCNCEDLDEAFDSFVKGEAVPESRRRAVMGTFQDRLRIPWRGGAKQVSVDAILPIFILPVILLLAANSLWWTIFSFTTMTVFLVFLFNFLIRNLPQTKFFLVWTITSSILLYVIFEYIVIPFLEILLEENIVLSLFIFGYIVSAYLCKVKANQLNSSVENEEGKGFAKYGGKIDNCSICQKSVPDKDHHCIWLDCCIGRHNQCEFIISLTCATASLLYSSNLTLTSVCHPFTLYKTILLPDDCSDVYQQFELGLSFVAALYSLFIAVILLILLLQQILFVSIGVSRKEWNTFSNFSKCLCGLTAYRPNSVGFIGNWARIICVKRRHNISSSQQL